MAARSRPVPVWAGNWWCMGRGLGNRKSGMEVGDWRKEEKGREGKKREEKGRKGKRKEQNPRENQRSCSEFFLLYAFMFLFCFFLIFGESRTWVFLNLKLGNIELRKNIDWWLASFLLRETKSPVCECVRVLNNEYWLQSILIFWTKLQSARHGAIYRVIECKYEYKFTPLPKLS